MPWTSRSVHGRVTAVIAALLGLVLVAGCGSSGGSTAAPTTPAPASATPVAVEHKFGSTEVPGAVERVATVGWNDQDFVLPLGVVPVVTREWFDGYDSYPWVQQATGGKGVEAVGGDGIDYEAIAAARPDLILAIYESIDQPTYDRLSQIAPTVVQSADYPDEETPWDVQLLTTGKALGREDQARRSSTGSTRRSPRPRPPTRTSPARSSSRTTARRTAATISSERATRAGRCSTRWASTPRRRPAT